MCWVDTCDSSTQKENYRTKFFFFPPFPGRGATGSVSPQEEEELRALSATPNIYDSLARSVAPSIYGSDDLKKAITCLLFGGSRKR